MTFASDNWEKLVKEYGFRIGDIYLDNNKKEWEFVGLLYGHDDFYYVMWRNDIRNLPNEGTTQLLTCVGSLAEMGFTSSKVASTKCPRSVSGDDGTVEQCIERGHCGCDERQACQNGTYLVNFEESEA